MSSRMYYLPQVYPFSCCINKQKSDPVCHAYNMVQCPYWGNIPIPDQFLWNQTPENPASPVNQTATDPPVLLKDYGPEPFVVNIRAAVRQNNNFRTALWTGSHLQLTLMSLNAGEDIGLEMHPNVDQFICIEEGQGQVRMGDNKFNTNFQRYVGAGYAVIIPAGKWHNLINTGGRTMKLYSVYAPPQHPHGTVHATKAIAQGAD